ncbi:hydrolase [Alpinimonas psychrophila]
MALSVIDPRTALVLIDLQEGIVALAPANRATEVVRKASELAKAFRHKRLPVILVTVESGAPGRTEQGRRSGNPAENWATVVPDIDAQPSDLRVTKHQWGAFTNTNLFEILTGLAVTQIVLGGLMTTKGVESTARAAHELGFNVTLAVDAMSDTNLAAHDNSVANVFPYLGETGTTEDIVALLTPDGS